MLRSGTRVEAQSAVRAVPAWSALLQVGSQTRVVGSEQPPPPNGIPLAGGYTPAPACSPEAPVIDSGPVCQSNRQRTYISAQSSISESNECDQRRNR